MSAEVPPARRCRRSVHERAATANAINDEKAEDESRDSLDRAVDARGKERILSSDEAELLEDSRRVVVDGLNSAKRLEE